MASEYVKVILNVVKNSALLYVAQNSRISIYLSRQKATNINQLEQSVLEQCRA